LFAFLQLSEKKLEKKYLFENYFRHGESNPNIHNYKASTRKTKKNNTKTQRKQEKKRENHKLITTENFKLTVYYKQMHHTQCI